MGTVNYAPSIERFINRDLIEEMDGINIYAFYTYDADNRLVRATGGGHDYRYAYDPQGRLVKVERDGAVEFRYYDGANMILRREQSDGREERVMWGSRSTEVIARHTPEHGWLYYHQTQVRIAPRLFVP